jgi:hypothetical protein
VPWLARYDKCSLLFTIIKISVTPKGSNPTSKNSNGWLILEGKCMLASLTPTESGCIVSLLKWDKFNTTRNMTERRFLHTIDC